MQREHVDHQLDVPAQSGRKSTAGARVFVAFHFQLSRRFSSAPTARTGRVVVLSVAARRIDGGGLYHSMWELGQPTLLHCSKIIAQRAHDIFSSGN